MLKIIHVTVNGREREIAVDERESLLDTLRNRLDLSSVKKGCEVGECGDEGGSANRQERPNGDRSRHLAGEGT